MNWFNRNAKRQFDAKDNEGISAAYERINLQIKLSVDRSDIRASEKQITLFEQRFANEQNCTQWSIFLLDAMRHKNKDLRIAKKQQRIKEQQQQIERYRMMRSGKSIISYN